MPAGNPKAFISYSWDNERHKTWVREFAARLRSEGVDAKLDQWELAPGDRLPTFMENEIRENEYVLIVCTPNYKTKSDQRQGGVGYEGDIMTGEVYTLQNHRKFIPVLRAGTFRTALPSWLEGKYGVDLSNEPYDENQYEDLTATLFKRRLPAPPIGIPNSSSRPAQSRSIREEAREFDRTVGQLSDGFEPIKITHIMVDEVGEPRDDGSRGSALYAVPFKLSRAPTHEWGEAFIRHWDHPPTLTSSHRSGIARVDGDRIVLLRTTIDEVEKTHRQTLKLAVGETNKEIGELVRKRDQEQKSKEAIREARQDDIRRKSQGMDFS